MDRVKGIAKNGYHPTGKDGGKESWRGDHKGINQVVSRVSIRVEHELKPTVMLLRRVGWGKGRIQMMFDLQKSMTLALSPLSETLILSVHHLRI